MERADCRRDRIQTERIFDVTEDILIQACMNSMLCIIHLTYQPKDSVYIKNNNLHPQQNT